MTAGGDRLREIPGLLGLRAVMGTWVVADHLRDWIFALLPALTPLRPVLSGGIALDTFFIMSGFVIAHVYAERLATPDRRRYRAFLWARVARLWPTNLVALAVMAVVVVAYAANGDRVDGAHYSIATFVGNVLMLHALPGVDPWNYPSWSVSTEMIAYLLFPLAAIVVARARRAVAVALAVGVIAAQAVVLPQLYSGSPTLAHVGLFWARPVGEIALGCALWSAWRYGIRRHRGWDLVAVSAVVGVVAIAYSGMSDPIWLVVAVALLGIVVVAVTGATGPVHRLLETRPVRWAGRTSYSRYLMHYPVLFACQLVLPGSAVIGGPLPVRVALVVLWFVLVFAAGGLTYRLVEEPARRWMRRRGPSEDGAPTAETQRGAATVTVAQDGEPLPSR